MWDNCGPVPRTTGMWHRPGHPKEDESPGRPTDTSVATQRLASFLQTLDLRDIYGIPLLFNLFSIFLSACVVWDACVCLICVYGCYCVWVLLTQCMGGVRGTLGVLLTFLLVFRWDFFTEYARLAGPQSPGLLLSAAPLSPSEHRDYRQTPLCLTWF